MIVVMGQRMTKLPNIKPRFAAVIVAAGTGERFGSDYPKQYLPLNGKSVLQYACNVFLSHSMIMQTVVVYNPDHLQYLEKCDNITFVEGGNSRMESVHKGLCALENVNPDYVLIHDGARPCVTSDLIDRVCQDLQSGKRAVIPALPVTDTLKSVETDKIKTSIDRSTLRAAQTPQGFDYGLLLDLYRTSTDTSLTDDSQLFEKGGLDVYVTQGEDTNIKITYPNDIRLAEFYLPKQKQSKPSKEKVA